MTLLETPVFYTRVGDDGYTAIYGQSERIPKFAPRPMANGAIDEAQAALGVLRAGNTQPKSKEIIIRVERDLYLMMGELAVAEGIKLPAKPIDQSDIDWLEDATRELGETTGGFRDFVLPGDTLSGAQAHVARTIVRRAERDVARLLVDGELGNEFILRYLNRLSSLLFVMALYEDISAGVANPTLAKNVRD